MFEVEETNRILIVHSFDPQQFAAIERLLTAIQTNQQKEIQHMAELDNDLVTLQAESARQTTVVASGMTLINGISKQVSDAVAAALAAGATPAQLKAITDVAASLKANDDQLAAAIAANTAAAPPGNPAPPPIVAAP